MAVSRIIAVLGGTGNLGLGLARRWALAGEEVVIGSRTAEKAVAAADNVRGLCTLRKTDAKVSGTDNVSATRAASIVVLTVPFAHQASTLAEVRPALQGKILVDTTVPLVPPKVARVQLPPEGSAGRIAQRTVGPDVQVVTAFHNVAAQHLHADQEPDCDVLVFGDSREAREIVIGLARAAGMRALHGGSLDNSIAAEALTSALIFMNKLYGCHSGIRITGIPDPAGQRGA